MPKATRRAPRREADQETERRIVSYRPAKVDASTWAAIRPFVLDCVRRLPLKGWPVAIRTLRVLTQLTAWALEQGMALDPELVFDPDTIERFVVEGLARIHPGPPIEQICGEWRRSSPQRPPGSLVPPSCHAARWHRPTRRLSSKCFVPMGCARRPRKGDAPPVG